MSEDAAAPSQQESFARIFISQSASLTSAVEMAFRTSSFKGWAKQLEDPHGWMHGIIGGGWDDKMSGAKHPGHMWPLEYSAYEPLFMLHHTYVTAFLVNTAFHEFYYTLNFSQYNMY